MNYLEIYIDEFNDKGIQIANAFLDVMRCKLTELGADSTDAFASIFDNSHIEAEQYYMNILSEDLKTSVYKGYKQDKIEMRGDRAEMSDFPLYLNTVAGGLDRRDQTIGGFSFVVKIYALPVVEIIG